MIYLETFNCACLVVKYSIFRLISDSCHMMLRSVAMFYNMFRFV